MNFKPTLIKTIVSILLGIIIGLAFAWQEIIYPASVKWTFFTGPFILFSIIGLAIIYLVWSLIQKKK